jgi:hypothetical protein
MKLSHYLAFITAAALLAGCFNKEASKPGQPPKGPAVTGPAAAKPAAVTPAPPPPVQAAKEPVQLFPPPAATNAPPSKTTEPAPSAKPAVGAKATPSAKPAATAPSEVKPAARAPGQPLAKVVMVKPDEKWLILQFPTNEIPAPGSHLTLYRGKDRVSTIKVTEPMDIPNLRVTADILDGKPERGDEVR